MVTLLLRLSSPMQSWGTQSHFTNRDTERDPSKSGVIGLLCAALGRDRNTPIDDLNDLRMGVRVDQEGVIRRDFHTAGMGGIYKVSGGVKKSLVTSDRYYLADAKFLVGLEGSTHLLYELQEALKNPTWFLFLGRKAFIPSERIWLKDGLKDQNLERVLSSYRWLGYGQAPDQLRLMLEDSDGAIVRDDQPLSFAERRFLPRRMTRQYIPTPVNEQMLTDEEDK